MARQRASLLITVFALLLVLFPFLFWYGTWFGRKLTDAQISEYLADRAKPRHAQHALVQVGERMARRDPTAARWYPQGQAAGVECVKPVYRLAALQGISDDVHRRALGVDDRCPVDTHIGPIDRKST